LVKDVCIIGGGSAGMNMAWNLKDRGYQNIRVIEKAGITGGMCNTVRFTGPNGTESWIEAGVSVFPSTSFANSIGLGPWSIDTVAIVERFAGKDAILPTVYTGIIECEADFSSGQYFGCPATVFPPTFQQDFQRFIEMASLVWPWTDTLVDVPSPIPSEFLMPFDDWLVFNNFTSLFAYFEGVLWYGGYGNFHNMTALDALLQSGSPTDMSYAYAPSTWFSVKRGCRSLYEGIDAYLGPGVTRLNATVQAVLRNDLPGVPVVLYGTQNGEGFVDVCEKLVVAIPPVPDEIAFLDPDSLESNLFASVHVIDTVVSQVEFSGPLADTDDKFFLLNVDPSNSLGQTSLPNLLTVARPNSFGPGVALSVSQTMLPLAEMEMISQESAQGIPASALTNITFVEFFEHQYNPRFSPDALASVPPYLQIDALQGHRKTYWVGAVRSTGDSTKIWEQNYQLLEKHFPPKI